MLIYLDESGTLTQSDGNYFIVATYSVGDARKITNLQKKNIVKTKELFSDYWTKTWGK